MLILFVCLTSNRYTFGQEANNEIKLSPVPEWVKKYPEPKLERSYVPDLVIVHFENQYNHITRENFWRIYYYLNNVEGLNKIKYYHHFYRPSYHSIQINSVIIHRIKEIIRIKDQLHIEHSLESKQIGGVVYDNVAQIKIFFNQAKVGDLIEIAFTQIGEQPDLHGILNYNVTPVANNLWGKSYIRLIAQSDIPIHYNVLNLENTPTIEKYNGQTEFEFIASNNKKINEPETPLWYSGKNEIFIYQGNSWKEIIDLNLKNFELDEITSDIIKNKVYELTNNLTSTEEKINAIFNFIQKDIFYLDYGLIDPKKPEMVLKNGFGDCKSKSLLTVKMLECLNVESWPVIVKNTGIDERLLKTYSIGIFNHCVVEFVMNKDTILFDPTLEPQKGSIYEKYVPNYRYGLRLIKNNTQLSKLKGHSNQSLNLTAIINKPNRSYKNKVRWEFELNGNLANRNNFLFKEQGTEAVFKTLSNDLLQQPFFSREYLNLYYSMDEDQPSSKLVINSKKYVQVFEGKDNLTFIPRPLYNWLKVIDKNKLGPYFSLPDFGETSQLFKIHLSNWMEFQPDSTSFKNNWIQYNKKTWQENDIIYALYSVKILESYLNSSNYKQVVKDIEFIKEDMPLSLDGRRRSYIQKKKEEILSGFAFLILASIIFAIWRLAIKRKKQRKLIARLTAENEILKSQLTNKNI